MTPLVSKVRGDVSPKKSLAFTATKSEYLRRFCVFRTVIPRNEPLGALDKGFGFPCSETPAAKGCISCTAEAKVLFKVCL